MELNLAEKKQLRDALLKCQSIQEDRYIVIRELSFGQTIPDAPKLLNHVVQIINTCAAQPNGFKQLFEVLDYFDDTESFPMQDLFRVWSTILWQKMQEAKGQQQWEKTLELGRELLVFEQQYALSFYHSQVQGVVNLAQAESDKAIWYRELLQAIQGETWPQAITLCEKLGGGYANVTALSQRAIEELAREKCYQQVQEAFQRRDWADVLKLGQPLPADYRDVADLARQAKLEISKVAEQQRIEAEYVTLYAQLQTAMKNKNWSQAEKLVDQLPTDYGDVSQFKQKITAQQQELAALYQKMQETWQGQDWVEVLDWGSKITARVGPYRDVPQLLEQARTQLAQAKQLAKQYKQLQQHIAQQEWTEAIGLGHQLLALKPGYREVTNLIGQAKQALAKEASDASHKTDTSKITFDWVTIPAGEFIMGTDLKKDPFAQKSEYKDWIAKTELPQHRLYLPEYQIARVPVTNEQWGQFLQGSGYEWSHRDKLWKDGLPHGKEKHPVVYVTWDDAVAFCEWAGVRLPTEAEWQKAARGTDGRLFPWGNEEPTKELCNFNGNVGDTTPVGAYPKGKSPYGCLDMAGNVWEWCSSAWGKNSDKPDFGYPYKADDGREDLTRTDVFRIASGGSWHYLPNYVRCAFRFRCDRGLYSNYVGFRVAVVVPIR